MNRFRGRGGSRMAPGDYVLEVVIGDEKDGGRVIRKLFKVTAYEGYTPGRGRRFGDDEDESQDESGARKDR